MPHRIKRWAKYYSDGAVELTSAEAVASFARFLDRCEHEEANERHSAPPDDQEDSEADEDETGYVSAGSAPRTPSRSSSPESAHDRSPSPSSSYDPSRPHLRSLTFAIPPSDFTPSFPTPALAQILAFARPTLTHLHLAHAEPLLTHAPTLLQGAFPRLSHLTASALGPRACAALRDMRCTLEDVELTFDDAWVAAVCSGAGVDADGAAHQPAVVPALPNGKPCGLPTPAPTPATTPAACAVSYPQLQSQAQAQAAAASAVRLPDPIPLLAHSMDTLRVLRASNAVFLAVADTLRYPSVRELRLRLVGVPLVTALVHAFPGVQALYVYTPYDGCALPGLPGLSGTQQLPGIDSTREANRTSQLYSSFAPMTRVSGFAPGLYALGLTCPVERLELGNVAPRLWVGAGAAPGTRERKPARDAAGSHSTSGGGVGVNEAEMVRRVVADTRPPTVAVTLGRGWWASPTQTHTHAHGSPRRGRRQGWGETGALRAMFDPGEEGSASGWAGVRALAVRVEEAGTWPAVSKDLSATLKPLAESLTTFVLRWDRTSVPFDRVPPDEDARTPPNSHGHEPPQTRTEALARRLAQDLPALRYICTEVVRDAPVPARSASVLNDASGSGSGAGTPTSVSSPRLPGSGASASSIWSAEAQHGVAEAVLKGTSSPLGSPAPAAPPAAAAAPPPPPPPPTIAPIAPIDVRFATGPPRIAVERRFWRVERDLGDGAGISTEGEGKEGREGREAGAWLCLDALDAEMGAKVLRDEGLGFEDVVRY